MGLDKTADGYQEEGVIKLLKDIRDGIAGNVIRSNRLNNRPNNDYYRPNRPNNDDYDDDYGDDSFYITPYDTPYTSDDEDDEDDTKKNIIIYCLKDELDKTKDDNKEVELKKKLKENEDKILDLETKLKDGKLSIEEKDKLYKKLDNNKNVDDASEKSYDSNGFDKDGFYKYADRKYDPNGFDKDGFYKDTNNKYNPNGFDINAKQRY